MPTPPKHWSKDTCPAHLASEKDSNIYYCPNDNCYFYRGYPIRFDGVYFFTEIRFRMVYRKSMLTLCSAIDKAVIV